MTALTRSSEAKILSTRIGLRWQACEAWMKANGINGIMDLKDRYPDLTHAEAMVQAEHEIENHILGIGDLGLTNTLASDAIKSAKLKASEPLRPSTAQKPCDIGLFSDEANQLDLIEMFMEPV